MAKILVLIADQFEDIELIAPVDIWRRAKFDVVLASISSSKSVTSQQHICIMADYLLKDIDVTEFDALFLPGGAGHKQLAESQSVQETITDFINQKKYIITICAATTVITKHLQAHKATCYPTLKDTIPNWIDNDVVTDIPFISAQGAGTALALGFKVLEILGSKEETLKLQQQMIYSQSKDERSS